MQRRLFFTSSTVDRCSTSMVSSEAIFPAETLCHILRYSSTKDVVRWRAVSPFVVSRILSSRVVGHRAGLKVVQCHHLRSFDLEVFVREFVFTSSTWAIFIPIHCISGASARTRGKVGAIMDHAAYARRVVYRAPN